MRLDSLEKGQHQSYTRWQASKHWTLLLTLHFMEQTIKPSQHERFMLGCIWLGITLWAWEADVFTSEGAGTMATTMGLGIINMARQSKLNNLTVSVNWRDKDIIGRVWTVDIGGGFVDCVKKTFSAMERLEGNTVRHYLVSVNVLYYTVTIGTIAFGEQLNQTNTHRGWELVIDKTKLFLVTYKTYRRTEREHNTKSKEKSACICVFACKDFFSHCSNVCPSSSFMYIGETVTIIN